MIQFALTIGCIHYCPKWGFVSVEIQLVVTAYSAKLHVIPDVITLHVSYDDVRNQYS